MTQPPPLLLLLLLLLFRFTTRFARRRVYCGIERSLGRGVRCSNREWEEDEEESDDEMVMDGWWCSL